MAFNPNQSTLAACLENIRSIQKAGGIETGRIMTSRSKSVRSVADRLAVKNIPDGFTKEMLPLYFDGPTTLYISSGAPHAVVPSHSHDEGPGIRIMISGSIHYKDMELTAGDWMYVPAGEKYEFTVGARGATMCYCYACCCA